MVTGAFGCSGRINEPLPLLACLPWLSSSEVQAQRRHGSLHARVATAHLLLNSDGDIDTVHGRLVDAINKADAPDRAHDPAIMS